MRRWRPQRARADWAASTLEERAAVFLRAADLLATTWRATLNAATMLGQSKTAFQAEIDAASELIDFWRFNPDFAAEIHAEQPISTDAASNRMDYRPLEGVVYAVTPFNFTSIAGNLPTAPALMGNTVVWKPAASSILSSYYVMRLLEAAASRRASSTSCPVIRLKISTSCSIHRSRRHPFHGEYPGLPRHVEEGRRQHRALQKLPSTRR